jgi:hypothetical protein
MEFWQEVNKITYLLDMMADPGPSLIASENTCHKIAFRPIRRGRVSIPIVITLV